MMLASTETFRAALRERHTRLLGNRRRSVDVPLGVRAVEVAHAGTGEHFRGHEARIDAHPVTLAVYGGPMRDAATMSAAVEPDGPVVPRVDVGRGIGGNTRTRSGG
jgi:hypothetical protein